MKTTEEISGGIGEGVSDDDPMFGIEGHRDHGLKEGGFGNGCWPDGNG